MKTGVFSIDWKIKNIYLLLFSGQFNLTRFDKQRQA